jgi:cytochrome P450
VVNDLLTFIIAGHETTAEDPVALAKDQASQQRTFEEAKAVADDGPITAAHVETLSHCRQVIQEAMRLFPPAPGIGASPRLLAINPSP